ncbi:Cadherin-18 Cadherin-14 [Collichthys lucidus]|uniref:Cadherin-18 Cadherin-14 n=1 Tax=Collichthys lucidus TaxID=240159 RepID=A0A4U5UZH7_COLLU|nr:Cadherin-18 Cadherin-14 [Collichthys lucidus]
MTYAFVDDEAFPLQTDLVLHSNSDKGDGSVKYILSGEGAGSIFIIDETSGDIHAAKSLDRESKSQYVLHARAIDRWTNRSLEAESEFIIKVQDVNDNAPTFPDGPFSATVPEMSDVGTSVFQVTASDADDPTYGNSAKIVYSILEGQPYFSVDPKTGGEQGLQSFLDEVDQIHPRAGYTSIRLIWEWPVPKQCQLGKQSWTRLNVA